MFTPAHIQAGPAPSFTQDLALSETPDESAGSPRPHGPRRVLVGGWPAPQRRLHFWAIIYWLLCSFLGDALAGRALQKHSLLSEAVTLMSRL